MQLLSKKLGGFRTSFRFPHTFHNFNLFSSGTENITFIPFGLNTLSPRPFGATTVVITLRKDGYECTATEHAVVMVLPFRGLNCVDGAPASGTGPGPCVLRISLHCGEKCKDVICESSSIFPGTAALEYGEAVLTFHNWIVPCPVGEESPDARSFGCQGHHVNAYTFISRQP